MPDRHISAIEQAVARGFEVLGRLDPADEDSAYLARERTTGRLVALTMDAEPADADPRHAALTVHDTFDLDLPARPTACPVCGAEVGASERFCGSCGGDVLGTPRPGVLLDRILDRPVGDLELLGEMPRGAGRAPVRFARDRNTGHLLALGTRPQPGRTEEGVAERNASAADSPAPAQGGTAAEAAARGDAGVADSAAATKLCPTCGREYSAAIRFCPTDGAGLMPRVRHEGLVGQIIGGRYQILRRLGEGGMGEVYLAEHVKMGRSCAIKLLHPGLAGDAEAVGRLSREAATAGRMHHPNVAEVYDFGETPDGLVYLAMEYVDGQALSEILEAAGGPLPLERAVDIARQVASALAVAHGLGIIHRDLKPDNILVTAAHDGGDLVKVVDFGIAKAVQSHGQTLTRTGYVVGTPRYMSPEQLVAEALDGRSDLYGLACILFEMLTGESPWGGPDALITRRLTGSPPHPSDINSAVPRAVDAVVVQALARAPDGRFQTADEFRAALESAAAQPARRSRWRVPWRDPHRRSGAQAAGGRRGSDVRSGSVPAAPADDGPEPAAGTTTPVAGSTGSGPIASVGGAAQSPTPAPAPAPRATTQVGAASASITAEEPTAEIPAGATAGSAGGALAARVRGTAARVAAAVPPLRGNAGLIAAGLVGVALLGGATYAASRFARREPPPRRPPPVAPAVPAQLRLVGQLPAGARLFDNDVPLAVNGQLAALSPGTHRLRLEAPGYETEYLTATVRANGTLDWPLQLRPQADSLAAAGAPPAVATVARVDIRAPRYTMAVGETIQLEAAARDAGGGIVAGRTIRWSSSDSEVASVDAAGNVRALSAGEATIRAASDAASREVILRVRAAPRERVAIETPSPLLLHLDDERRIAVSAYDAAGAELPAAAIHWESSDPLVARVDSAGVVRALTPGEAKITAKTDRAFAWVMVSVTAPPAIGTPDAGALARFAQTTVKRFRADVDGGREAMLRAYLLAPGDAAELHRLMTTPGISSWSADWEPEGPPVIQQSLGTYRFKLTFSFKQAGQPRHGEHDYVAEFLWRDGKWTPRAIRSARPAGQTGP